MWRVVEEAREWGLLVYPPKRNPPTHWLSSRLAAKFTPLIDPPALAPCVHSHLPHARSAPHKQTLRRSRCGDEGLGSIVEVRRWYAGQIREAGGQHPRHWVNLARIAGIIS